MIHDYGDRARDLHLRDVRRSINLGLVTSEVAFTAALAWEALWSPGTGTLTREMAAFWFAIAIELA